MKYDKDGKLNYWDRQTIDVLNGSDWDIEKLCEKIVGLSEQVEELEVEVDMLKEEINNHVCEA